MKQSNLSFEEGFLRIQAEEAKRNGNTEKVFDYDKAAAIIKEKYQSHNDLVAEAGLQGDWIYTGGIIFEKGKPTNRYYTYLTSNWAIPTLILSYNGKEQEEIECYTEDENTRFTEHNTWDEQSLNILGIPL